MTDRINLTEEKIAISIQLIKILEESILNPKILTNTMLKNIKDEAEDLLKSDF